MIRIIRHGDLGLVRLDNLPAEKGLVVSKSKVIMVGSGGNDHAIDNGEIYFHPYGKYDIGFLVAKNTTLIHPDHGNKCGQGQMRKAKLKDGVYGLIKQKEQTHQGMRPVTD